MFCVATLGRATRFGPRLRRGGGRDAGWIGLRQTSCAVLVRPMAT